MVAARPSLCCSAWLDPPCYSHGWLQLAFPAAAMHSFGRSANEPLFYSSLAYVLLFCGSLFYSGYACVASACLCHTGIPTAKECSHEQTTL
eukprot:353538-Chlamydomonas_euryale.AAC.1